MNFLIKNDPNVTAELTSAAVASNTGSLTNAQTAADLLGAMW